MPQSLVSLGSQAGTGIALVLERLAFAVTEGAFAWVAAVVAIAPVRARAMTRVRTKSFMVDYSLFGYSEWAELDISLDRPDGTTLGFRVL
jgi:hypothetical protein